MAGTTLRVRCLQPVKVWQKTRFSVTAFEGDDGEKREHH
jgi:hypothetical protein